MTLSQRPNLSLLLPFQKLSSSPQRNQGGSVSSPHASQPSQEESSPCSDISSYEEPPSPLSAASSGPLAPAPAPTQVSVHRRPSRASDQEGCSDRDGSALAQRFLPNDPSKWNVEEVYEFIRSLPGQRESERRKHTLNAAPLANYSLALQLFTVPEFFYHVANL